MAPIHRSPTSLMASPAGTNLDFDTRIYDAIGTLVLLLVIFEGLLSFPAKIFGFEPVLSATRHLGAPEWWIVSVLVIVAGGVLLETIDRAKRHAHPSV